MAVIAPEFHPDSSLVAEVKASPNHGERKGGANIDMLVLHYTGMEDAAAAVRHLCQPGTDVSAHYVVLEDGHIVQCVPEARRAWHAGASSWKGATDINSRSIGIEIANPGHGWRYDDFPDAQIAAVIALGRDILARHPIPPWRVLAHSDVAPMRKQDPGEKFPWDRLAAAGVGAWVAPEPITQSVALTMGDKGPKVRDLQAQLAEYGYGLLATGQYDEATRAVVAAFQRHFRPSRVDGLADTSTLRTLSKLLAARAAVG
ncbi:MAG: N-acetylmuramoyl-L-alanine amidase [Xanthobacteraceae bacterium]